MVMNIADALAAYRQGSGGMGKAGSVADTGGESFADTLKSFADDALGSIKSGEKAATAAATGKSDLATVVTAINNAELTLQTIVTIRDKVISAYQSIVQTQM